MSRLYTQWKVEQYSVFEQNPQYIIYIHLYTNIHVLYLLYFLDIVGSCMWGLGASLIRPGISSGSSASRTLNYTSRPPRPSCSSSPSSLVLSNIATVFCLHTYIYSMWALTKVWDILGQSNCSCLRRIANGFQWYLNSCPNKSFPVATSVTAKC